MTAGCARSEFSRGLRGQEKNRAQVRRCSQDFTAPAYLQASFSMPRRERTSGDSVGSPAAAKYIIAADTLRRLFFQPLNPLRFRKNPGAGA